MPMQCEAASMVATRSWLLVNDDLHTGWDEFWGLSTILLVAGRRNSGSKGICKATLWDHLRGFFTQSLWTAFIH